MEDNNIMIDFEEIKEEDKFVVDLKSFRKKEEGIETIGEVNKGAFHGFDATDIPKSKIKICLNSSNLMLVDRVENHFMEEMKEENDDETGEDCEMVTNLKPKKGRNKRGK